MFKPRGIHNFSTGRFILVLNALTCDVWQRKSFTSHVRWIFFSSGGEDHNSHDPTRFPSIMKSEPSSDFHQLDTQSPWIWFTSAGYCCDWQTHFNTTHTWSALTPEAAQWQKVVHIWAREPSQPIYECDEPESPAQGLYSLSERHNTCFTAWPTTTDTHNVHFFSCDITQVSAQRQAPAPGLLRLTLFGYGQLILTLGRQWIPQRLPGTVCPRAKITLPPKISQNEPIRSFILFTIPARRFMAFSSKTYGYPI